ncbi:3-oxoacid CoA-transferase subunit B [Brevibacillus sp. NRS-1366]|uniref:3-oxoacid CoA-transferase subunit B n=1 Tax=Brevibacillus sp. NRS-1366 TaxID=3233899 RepID=UPI003D192D21
MNGKELIAKTIAKELKQGEVVNLGIGIPTLVCNYLSEDSGIFFHSENGILGVGEVAKSDEVDKDLVNAGKIPVTVNLGASFFDSAASFAMIRGGHVDVAVIGALEVDEQGRVANWLIPGQNVLGVGGAMDLIEGVRRIIVAITHTTKDGSSKIVKLLGYPKSSERSVDMVVTELAVFKVVNHELILSEIAPGVTLDEIKEKTEATFTVDEQLLKQVTN